MHGSFALLLVVLALGYAFEFVNGFHDAANAVATIIATRVLPPYAAVIMSGVLNFAGAVSGTAVAATVGKGLVNPNAVTLKTVAAGLIAGVLWDLATWYRGIPTSSSHALIFGVLGAGVATGGFNVIVINGVKKVAFGVAYSPIVALIFGALIMIALYWLLYRLRTKPGTVRKSFGRLQLISSAYMSFTHGSNDGQKTMGILALALFTYGSLGHTFYVPFWIIASAATAMALGTATGGYRIIKTMGFKLVDLDPINGFAAETAAATVIEVATRFGIPISTTHAINGSILGVGLAKDRRAVKWGVARTIVIAWILTLPGAAILGWVTMRVIVIFFGAH